MKMKADGPILSSEFTIHPPTPSPPVTICPDLVTTVTLDRFPWAVLGKLRNDPHGEMDFHFIKM